MWVVEGDIEAKASMICIISVCQAHIQGARLRSNGGRRGRDEGVSGVGLTRWTSWRARLPRSV